MEMDKKPLGSEVSNIQERTLRDLARIKHFDFAAQDPAMRVWILMTEPFKTIFPWWSYTPELDDDIKALNDIWQVSDPSCLFDILFLSSLKKSIGGDCFLILSGAIRNENWGDVSAAGRYAFSSGEECSYQLHGSFSERLSINWTPLWQPHRVVKAPPLPVLWRLFRQSAGADSPRVLSFFYMPELKNYEPVLELLRNPDPKRSEKLTQLVKWFGLFSSSSMSGSRPGCVVYSNESEDLEEFEKLRAEFVPMVQKAQALLAEDTRPRVVLKFLTTHFSL